MCLAVYIAADSDLATVAWQEASPSVYVEEAKDFDRELRNQFSKRHIYYVGSHEGCGCGFRRATSAQRDDTDVEARRMQASHQELATYLHQHLDRAGTIEMFACWEGDQGKPASDRGVIDPSTIASESFYFEELARWTIKAREITRSG